jgi:tryptophan-rich sensory protein
MSPAVVAFVICGVAAGLEGALAGRGVRARFVELRLPPYSPSLPAWFLIGGAYYVICFVVLYRLLRSGPLSGSRAVAFILLLMLMALNAAWGVLFFRLKNLRASFLAFVPYGVLTLLLVGTLAITDRMSALLLAAYSCTWAMRCGGPIACGY